jgi:hypothetical protein
MADGDTTSGGPERRLRRVEPGDPALIRRAEEAEVTVRTLEGHVAELRRSLREAEEEQRRTAEQLAEREHDVRRVKQREYAEQQLRVEAEEQRERLEREQRGELDRLLRRLAAGERHARELSERLEIVRRELSEAEQAAATGRAAARRAELELAERESELARRELELEQRLDDMHRSYARMEGIMREFKALALRLRSIQVPVAAPAQPEREEPNREDMANALAAAVARLRARVVAPAECEEEQPEVEQELESAAPGLEPAREPEPPLVEPEPALESVEPEPAFAEPASVEPEPAFAEPASVEPEPAFAEPASVEPEPAFAEPASVEPEPASVEPEPAPEPFTPRVLPLTAQSHSWLAPAIRRVAERRDPKLAGELICELLPVQRAKRPLGYTLRIEGLGDVQVRIEGERTTVRRPSDGGGEQGDFLLEGPAVAFAELAAGGTKRRLIGVKVHGSRRKLRRLLASRRAPLALSDLVTAEVPVWPGLLLLALSEAIDPLWTKGHGFVLAFVVRSPPGLPSATLYVQARDGQPLAVTRVRGEQPHSTVELSERAFLCVLAGAPLPTAEQVLLEGSKEPLELLLGWSDRAQSLAS